jgi:hypothetical protein
MSVAAAVLVIFNGGRAYQDQLQERRGRVKKLYEKIVPLANDFARFLQTSSSRTRDVSVFQATIGLYNVNAQQLAVWFHGTEEARMALDWWHHYLVKRLGVLIAEEHYTAPVLVDLFKEISQLAYAYDRHIEEFRTHWESTAISGPKEVGKTFERFCAEYNAWLLQFRNLRDEAAKTLSANLEVSPLMQQPALATRTQEAAVESPKPAAVEIAAIATL